MLRRSPSAAGPRREVPHADLDRLGHSRHLYFCAADPEEIAAADHLSEAVRGAVAAALTERQRTVVELYFFEGLSQGQIAARLGMTQQVVHKCLHGTARGGRLIGGALCRLREALTPVWLQRQAAALR